MLQLDWIKSEQKSWCSFEHVNLSLPHFDNRSGVYVIFRGDGPTVRVGQGEIRGRLTTHRSDQAILNCAKGNPLLATWATVPAAQRDGVERFLAETLKPMIGDRFPDCSPIQVNLPC